MGEKCFIVEKMQKKSCIKYFFFSFEFRVKNNLDMFLTRFTHMETKNNCFIHESPCRRVSTLPLDRLHLIDKPGSFEDSKISSLDRVDRWVERGVNEER